MVTNGKPLLLLQIVCREVDGDDGDDDDANDRG